MQETELGLVIILNSAPRAGKSSIITVIQNTFEGPWMNLGVDTYVRHITPVRYQPGIGLRPRGERRALEPFIPVFYAALYESVAAHSRHGLSVVMDVGHHDAHSVRQGVLADCARRLVGLPVLFVGVRCPLSAIMERRRVGQPGREGEYLVEASGTSVPDPVQRWKREVHIPSIYDLEVDTSVLDPETCANVIRQHLESGMKTPTAFQRLMAQSIC